MSQMVGADVEQLRQLSRAFASAGQQLDSLAADLSVRLAATTWVGADATRFRDDWERRLRVGIRQVCDTLGDAALTTGRNADDQERVSSSDLGSGGVSAPVAPQVPPEFRFVDTMDMVWAPDGTSVSRDGLRAWFALRPDWRTDFPEWKPGWRPEWPESGGLEVDA